MKNIFNHELKKSEKFNQYYTKPEIAEFCYQKLKTFLYDKSNILFVEPSAGKGVFLDIVQEEIVGFDIDPDHDNIKYADFLTTKIDFPKKQIVFIGNPPFGKKSNLAIKFVNKALEYSNIVGFIVPIQFRKWSVQSKINPFARLILDETIPEKSFQFEGKDYELRCCFQIWILDSFSESFTNIRLVKKPNICHPDFKLYQYNRTIKSEKYFNYNWDFAVPRQGYVDYNIKAYSKGECNRKWHWLFFKAKDILTVEKLKQIDFKKLSLKNIGTPGFGKADVISEYITLFKKNER